MESDHLGPILPQTTKPSVTPSTASKLDKPRRAGRRGNTSGQVPSVRSMCKMTLGAGNQEPFARLVKREWPQRPGDAESKRETDRLDISRPRQPEGAASGARGKGDGGKAFPSRCGRCAARGRRAAARQAGTGRDHQPSPRTGGSRRQPPGCRLNMPARASSRMGEEDDIAVTRAGSSSTRSRGNAGWAVRSLASSSSPRAEASAVRQSSRFPKNWSLPTARRYSFGLFSGPREDGCGQHQPHVAPAAHVLSSSGTSSSLVWVCGSSRRKKAIRWRRNGGRIPGHPGRAGSEICSGWPGSPRRCSRRSAIPAGPGGGAAAPGLDQAMYIGDARPSVRAASGWPVRRPGCRFGDDDLADQPFAVGLDRPAAVPKPVPQFRRAYAPGGEERVLERFRRQGRPLLVRRRTMNHKTRIAPSIRVAGRNGRSPPGPAGTERRTNRRHCGAADLAPKVWRKASIVPHHRTTLPSRCSRCSTKLKCKRRRFRVKALDEQADFRDQGEGSAVLVSTASPLADQLSPPR